MKLENVQILVVEDEAITRMAMVILLEYQGAIVMAAGSVQGAEQFLSDGFEPDFLLSNLRLPDGTGANVLRTLRSIDQQCDRTTPAIALTGESLDTVRDDPTLAGFDVYLAKPYDPAILVGAIERSLQKE